MSAASPGHGRRSMWSRSRWRFFSISVGNETSPIVPRIMGERPHSKQGSKGWIMSHERPLGQGVLEMHPKGHGFLRTRAKNYVPQTNDPYVSVQLLKSAKLREGLFV